MSDPNPLRPIPDSDIDELWRSLRRHVASRVRGHDQAEDVVQDAWLKLLSRPPARRDRLRGWLRVVAERLVLESSRRRRNQQRREQAVARAEADEGANGHASEEQGAVLRLLEDLREPYREVVRLRYVDDLGTAEIATRLGRSEATVRSQLKRGLDLLRARLGVQEDPAWEERKRPRGLLSLLPLLGPRRGSPTIARSPLRRVVLPAAAAGFVGALLIAVWSRSADALGPERDVRSAFASDEGDLESASGPAAALVAADADRPAERVALGASARSRTTPEASGSLAFELRGRVLSRIREDEAPLAGARILAARDPDATPEVVGRTGDDGRFVVNLTELPVWVGAEHDEHASTRRVRVDRRFLRSGEEVLLESRRTGALRGLVVDASGAPLAGREVRVGAIAAVERPRRGLHGLLERPPGATTVRTDAEGRFTCPPRESGRCLVEVFDEVLGEHEFPVVDIEKELRFVLDGSQPRASAPAPSRTAAIGSATLRGRLSIPAGTDDPGIDLLLNGEALAHPLRVTPDEDLRFEIGSLPTGPVELLIEGGGALGAWRAAELSLADGEVHDLGPVVVPAPGSLRVRAFRGVEEQPEKLTLLRIERPGASFQVNVAWSRSGLVRTEPDLAVAFDRIWPGEYRLIASGKGTADAIASATVEPARSCEVALALEPGGPVLVGLRFPDEVPPDESVEFRLHSPRGVELREFGDVGEIAEVGVVLPLRVGVRDDVHRVEARTRSGLRGHVDLGKPIDARARKVWISLAGPAAAGG